MSSNRRLAERLPVGFYVQQVVDGRMHRCFTADVSALGMYMEKPVEQMDRSSNIVQLEIPLPKCSETLWAKGEIVYDSFDPLFHGTAIRFTGMARRHKRILRDWLRQAKKKRGFVQRNLFRAGPREAFACAARAHDDDPARARRLARARARRRRPVTGPAHPA